MRKEKRPQKIRLPDKKEETLLIPSAVPRGAKEKEA